MPEPIFMKLGMYIMAPEPISTSYFINPFRLCVCMCITPSAARQRLGKHVLEATNTCNNRKVVDHVVFCVVRVASKDSLWVCLCIPLSLLGNGSCKHVPAAMKNCWRRRFLCGPCYIKTK
jgi:hypothetical protein